MRADYQIDRHVRLLRCAGWLICALLGLAVVLAMAWKIAQVSEQRALQATREHLAASLNSLAAEHLARHRELGAQWRKTNPFVLLRWEQDNYCGELPAGQAPQSACWYWRKFSPATSRADWRSPTYCSLHSWAACQRLTWPIARCCARCWCRKWSNWATAGRFPLQ